jgi:glycosyltransferase involved in cell wall biosynthesis
MPSIIDRRGKTEGIPVSLMEGLAMKLPAVASELSGIPELIEHGKNGFLVAAGDPAELAESIETLYRNPKLARSMGEQGRRTIEKKHDLSRNVKRLYDLIAR